MSLLKLLGLDRSGGEAEQAAVASTPSVRAIMVALKVLPPDRARYLAAFAFVLGRAASADHEVSEAERRRMAEIVARFGDLAPEQARLVVELAAHRVQEFGGTEGYQATRELVEISTRAQREQLLHCLFAVAAADESISGAEEAQLRQIAAELGFSHRDYVDIRAVYSDKREVLKG